MNHWKLTLSYDGTSFHGWQVQPGLPTVQGTLAEAIARVSGETVLPQGSGRTDAGVHALAQVASCALEAPIPPTNFLRALNAVLPPSIRITAAEHAPADFHARHSAIRKTYEYRIFEQHPGPPPDHTNLDTPELDNPQNWVPHSSRSAWRDEWAPRPPNARICPPFLAPFTWDCRWPLDLDRLQTAAALLLGRHDFASFAASDPDRATRADEPSEPLGTVRTLFASSWSRSPDTLIYRVTGSGFLHHMVRNIVGTLVEVGRGSLAPADIERILAARDRSTAGPTAPARGLFLVDVEYGPASRPEVSR